MTRPTLERVEIPTPSSDGPVNVFILKGDAIVLIDTGPITRPGVELLRQALRRVGAQFKHVDAILLTQAHMDHFGMASVIGDRSNAVVCSSPAERELMEDYPAAYLRQMRSIGDYAERHGFPAALFRRVSGLDRAVLGCARPLRLDVSVRDGQTMDFGNISLRVIQTPGLPFGGVCYYETRQRALFSGDVLMERPSPAVYFNGYAPPSRRVGLSHYLKSLRRLRTLAVGRLCPGHSRHSVPVKSAAQAQEKRSRITQRRVLRALREEPKTADTVAVEISCGTRVVDRWRAFAGTLGVLEYLQRKLKVRAEPDAQGRLKFALR